MHLADPPIADRDLWLRVKAESEYEIAIFDHAYDCWDRPIVGHFAVHLFGEHRENTVIAAEILLTVERMKQGG